MILGVGIDVVNITKIAEKKTDEFIKRLLTESELKKYQELKDDRKENMFLSVRWALKEAIYKSLKTKQLFTDLEIKKINGSYECFLVDDNTINLHLSVSYESNTISAICIAESNLIK
ncbi:holo-ACP synthase [Mycoplasmoides alvi]|uniref:holo-ACP synthase n=1 Tax=Mycoplasmoides alvi TaxID=78580 RepID=UPI00051BED19|nr:holo-ACP synthase [Mycoplasmoides alvi]